MKPDRITNSPVASAIWDELQQMLATAGKWREEYQVTFEPLVDAIVECRVLAEANAAGTKKFHMVSRRTHNEYGTHAWIRYQKAVNDIIKLSAKFGLTPFDHARMKSAGTLSMGELFAAMAAGPQLEQPPQTRGE